MGKLDLYEGQNFVLHNGRRVVLGRDDLDHNAVDEVSVGHLDVEAVTTVLHARFQHLHGMRTAAVRESLGFVIVSHNNLQIQSIYFLCGKNAHL